MNCLSKPSQNRHDRVGTVPRRGLGRTLALWFVVAGLVSSLGACDSEIETANSAPRVTWVAVQPPMDGDPVAEVTVWISDREGNPVNLTLELLLPDGETLEVALDSGGHGLVGLTTQEARFDPNGQPHLLRWDTSGLEGASVQLAFSPQDTKGGAGLRVVTPFFEVASGLKEAVPAEIGSSAP